MYRVSAKVLAFCKVLKHTNTNKIPKTNQGKCEKTQKWHLTNKMLKQPCLLRVYQFCETFFDNIIPLRYTKRVLDDGHIRFQGD